MSEFPKVLPPVARSVNLPCKKCEVDRFHVVLTHIDSRSAKVKCEVCGSTKTFKIPSEESKKRALSSRSQKATPVPKSVEIWEDMNQKFGSDVPRPYRLQQKFETHTAIQHPKFGLGFVTLATDTKIEVVFRDSARSLVHNRTT